MLYDKVSIEVHILHILLVIHIPCDFAIKSSCRVFKYFSNLAFGNLKNFAKSSFVHVSQQKGSPVKKQVNPPNWMNAIIKYLYQNN